MTPCTLILRNPAYNIHAIFLSRKKSKDTEPTAWEVSMSVICLFLPKNTFGKRHKKLAILISSQGRSWEAR